MTSRTLALLDLGIASVIFMQGIQVVFMNQSP